MKLLKKSEWLLFPSMLAEPEISWASQEYAIERLTKEDGTVVWFGYGTNWVKEPNQGWTKLADKGEFIPCEPPIYEQLYQQQYPTIDINDIQIAKEALNGLQELEEFQEGWEKDRQNLRDLITKLTSIKNSSI